MDGKSQAEILGRLGIAHVDPDTLDVVRVRCGRGFRFRDAGGRTIRHGPLRKRCVALAIPPAWADVRIASNSEAHIQAVGRDQRGRLQYIYHERWPVVREADKANRLRTFGRALPRIRRKLARDLRRPTLDRRMIVAAAVALVANALLRPGYASNMGDEGGRGAATLLRQHVAVDGPEVRLSFKGKGRRPVEKELRDPALARVLGLLKAQPGARLFKEVEGRRQKPVSAEELNDYLRSVSGADLTAKDFRSFHASSQALEVLAPLAPARSRRARQRQVLAAAREVAAALQNTPAVTRASYIHPLILESFERGELSEDLLRPPARTGLSRAETALMRFLSRE